MPEVDLEFLARQLALVLEGQREMSARLARISALFADIEATRTGPATGDPIERLLGAHEEGTDPAEARMEVLRELLVARIRAARQCRSALGASLQSAPSALPGGHGTDDS